MIRLQYVGDTSLLYTPDMQEYQAYLLRFQRGKDQTHWQVTLENAHTGERLLFADEREMFRYLINVLAIPSPGPGRYTAPDDSD